MEEDKFQSMLEEHGIHVNIVKENGETCHAELETFTDGGVNMLIYLDPFTLEEFNLFCQEFDIEEEVDLHRQSQDYRRAFTISESVMDFTNFIHRMRDLCEKLSSENTQDPEPSQYKVWMRCGVNVYGSKEEIQSLLNGDESLLKAKMNNGQFTLIGESYIPEECIMELLEEHPEEFDADEANIVDFFIR